MSISLAGDEAPLVPTPAVSEFSRRFDELIALGFVRTQRQGATGGGHPLEAMPGLTENYEQVVFVGAKALGNGAAEEFHYQSAVWCQHLSLERFLRIAEDGDIVVELRMHIESTGGVRNHGTAFRIRKDRLGELYAYRTVLR